MNLTELLSVNTIPKEISKSLFEQSKQGLVHTPYKDEIRLFSCVKEGDVNKLLQQVKPFMESGIFVGEMSDNNLMQYKYMSVSTITLATRYAIQGGLDEHIAYNFSDKFIRNIDSFNSTDKILSYLAGQVIELTTAVKENREKVKYSPHIRRAILYIDKNITKKLSVKEIANHCNISSDYLSYLFKKETGENLSQFILKQKLEISKTLLWEGYDKQHICSALSFCSPSHFISSFKKTFGITPNEYLSQK